MKDLFNIPDTEVYQPTLWEQPKELIPMGNKIDANYSKPVKKMKKTQAERIYDFIENNPGCTQREISEITKIPRHLIPDRINNRLMPANRVRIAGSRIDEISKLEVTTYEVV